MIRSIVAFLVATILVSTICGASAQVSVVSGSCVIINQSLDLGADTVLSQSLDCVPKKPQDAFRVRYVWLDSNSTSFVLANVITSELEVLLGPNPVIVRNEVLDEINEIWRIFGVKSHINDLNDNNPSISELYLSNSLIGLNGTAKSGHDRFSDLSREKLQNIVFYAATSGIIWPMLDEYSQIIHRKNFPRSMNLTYGGHLHKDSRSVDFHNDVFRCTYLYDFVSKEEFGEYWNDARRLEEKAEKDGKLMQYLSYRVPAEARENVLYRNQNTLTLASISYFTRYNWPHDFILRYINQSVSDGCAAMAPEVRVSAIPRQLFVKFAVVQAKHSGFEIKGYNYILNQRRDLRISDKYNPRHSKQFTLGEVGRERGQSLLIPIGIELRYPLGEFPFRFVRENFESNRLHRIIAESDVQSFHFPQYDSFFEPMLAKRKRAFRKPVHTQLTQTYRYGPAIQIEAITVGSETMKVRPAPAVASLLNGHFEEGSCPFLYFELADGSLVKHGRILVGASGSEKAREEYVEIPDGAVRVIIREEEPEVSFLSQIAIQYDSSDRNHEIATMIRLNPGTEMSFRIENTRKVGYNPPGQKRRIKISGFYIPLN